MAYSKVILNGTTLMDVTEDTVTADTLAESYTATKNDGTKLTGTLSPGGGGGKLLWYTDSGFTNVWVDQAMTETALEHYDYDLHSAWDAIVGATSVQLYYYINANSGRLYSAVNFNFDTIEDEIALYFTTSRNSWSDNNWRTVYLT